MQREELIEKIKNLLALATSPNEHEAKLAMERAQSLMAKYSIEHCDLSTAKIEEQILKELYEPKLENPLPVYLHNYMLLNALMQPICMNFGCYPYFMFTNGSQWMMGFKTNIEISKYACDVLLNQGIKDFRREYKQKREIGFATTFWNGFIVGLTQRFTKLSDETAIVLYDKVKQKLEEEVKTVPLEAPTSTATGFESGVKSATDTQLNPAISTSSGRMLK